MVVVKRQPTWGNDQEIEFQEIEIGIFQDIETLIRR
jgi:hypothetical protein